MRRGPAPQCKQRPDQLRLYVQLSFVLRRKDPGAAVRDAQGAEHEAVLVDERNAQIGPDRPHRHQWVLAEDRVFLGVGHLQRGAGCHDIRAHGDVVTHGGSGDAQPLFGRVALLLGRHQIDRRHRHRNNICEVGDHRFQVGVAGVPRQLVAGHGGDPVLVVHHGSRRDKRRHARVIGGGRTGLNIRQPTQNGRTRSTPPGRASESHVLVGPSGTCNVPPAGDPTRSERPRPPAAVREY